MKLLYGTKNPAKLLSMKRRLKDLQLEIIGLNEFDKDIIPNINEIGSNPLENAVVKATEYYKAFNIPTFSCDTGLYIDKIPDELQPGVYVRRVNGTELNDKQMIEYYSGLAKKYGDLKAKYKNAVCLVLDNEHIYKAMRDDMASSEFILTSKPHKLIRKGFPLDSLSIDIKTGKYFYDLENEDIDQIAVEDGFLQFFKDVLKKQ